MDVCAIVNETSDKNPTTTQATRSVMGISPSRKSNLGFSGPKQLNKRPIGDELCFAHRKKVGAPKLAEDYVSLVGGLSTKKLQPGRLRASGCAHGSSFCGIVVCAGVWGALRLPLGCARGFGETAPETGKKGPLQSGVAKSPLHSLTQVRSG